VPAPISGAGHVRHGAAGYEDEVIGAEVFTEAAGVDGALYDAFGDRREVCLLGDDVVPARLVRAEKREAERGAGLGGFQVAVEQPLESTVVRSFG
jgi:hypothetical protein